MTLELSVYDCLCSTDLFVINGVVASASDFGMQYDDDPDSAEEYCCGDMRFFAIASTKAVLEKYNITEDEYEEIAVKLTEKLSFGSCGWCS